MPHRLLFFHPARPSSCPSSTEPFPTIPDHLNSPNHDKENREEKDSKKQVSTMPDFVRVQVLGTNYEITDR